MSKIVLILLIVKFAYSNFNIFTKYEYGIPFKHSDLGTSMIKSRYIDSLKFDKNQTIYGSFGKGSKITVGIENESISFLGVFFSCTYHLPTSIEIERNFQGYDDSESWTFSTFSFNLGLKIMKKIERNILSLSIAPGYYYPLFIEKRWVNTPTDSYYNVIGNQESLKRVYKYNKGSFGYLFSIEYTRIIKDKLKINIGLSPEMCFIKPNMYYEPGKISYSSLRLSVGIGLLLKKSKKI